MDVFVTIEKINDAQEFASKKNDGTSFKKFSFVGKTNEQYPQTICFSCTNEEVWSKFNLNVGAQVQVYFNIRSKEWNGRWYNEISAWKVVPTNGYQQTPVPNATPLQETSTTPPQQSEQDGGKEDLPF